MDKVIFVGKKFTLGICACGCKQSIPIKHPGNNRKLKRFVNHHNAKGENNPAWKGGRQVNWGGYILIWCPKHHFADHEGFVREHRLVYEEYHKCCLLTWTIVHHINGVKNDNKPENLEAMTNSQHGTLHHEQRKKY